MARRGTKLIDLSIREVKDRLRTETDGKAVKRLVVAREYLDGMTAAEIAAKYGWAEQTIYTWLDRFEERSVDAALYDDTPPGRPPALDRAERDRLADALEHPPPDAGIDAPRWTPELARRFIREEFGHEYTRRHVRRLLADANHGR